MADEKWEHKGSAEGALSSMAPGPSIEWVENTESGEWSKVYVGSDQTVGEAIANGQFKE